MATYCDHVIVVRVQLSQALAQPVNQCIDGLISDAAQRIRPNHVDNVLALYHVSVMLDQQSQQPKLGWRQRRVELATP
jgi:hypothetical protein